MKSYTFTVTATVLTTGEPAFVVTCAELPSFMTQGLTVDGALQNALDLLREWRQDWPDVPLSDGSVSSGAAAYWQWSLPDSWWLIGGSVTTNPASLWNIADD